MKNEHHPDESELGLTDQSLVRRFRSGDEDAATALYKKYANRLMNLTDRQVFDDVLLQADPEGIVQSVFRTFFRRASTGQYSAVEGEDLWKLMLVIALNKIRRTGNFHRAAKRSVKRTESLTDNKLGFEAGSEQDEYALTNLRITINELLGELPEEHQRIITARIESYEIVEIAEQVKRSKRSVERILQQFRQRLHAIFESENQS